MFADRMRAAIDGATTAAQFNALMGDIWRAHGDQLTDDEAQGLAERIEGRRRPARENAPIAPRPPGRPSIFPRRVRQRSPDKVASRERAREVAATGWLPPSIAKRYSPGQQAVLTIVAKEFIKDGVCSLSMDEIGARAGVSGRWTQETLHLAASDGLLLIQERPKRADKHDTNLVRILSEEWTTWAKRRSKKERSAHVHPKHRVNSKSPHEYRELYPVKSVPLAHREGLPRGSWRLQPTRPSWNRGGL